MSIHPDHDLPEGLLYILVSENNDTGLSSERARQLAGAILMEMRTQLRKAMPAPDSFFDPPDLAYLCNKMGLHATMEDMPRQSWESSPGRQTTSALLESNRLLREERDEARRQLADCARRLLELQAPGVAVSPEEVKE